jgi:hypothetical protein
VNAADMTEASCVSERPVRDVSLSEIDVVRALLDRFQTHDTVRVPEISHADLRIFQCRIETHSGYYNMLIFISLLNFIVDIM